MSHPQPHATMRLALLFLGLPLVACSPSQDNSAVQAKGTQTDGIARVITIPVAAQDLTSTITVPGSVQAIQSADLYARVSGYLAEISVDLGDEVTQDQILARISVPELEAELAQAAAEIESARSQVDQQTAAVASARAGANAANANRRAIEAGTDEKTAQLALAQSEFDRWQYLANQSQAIEPKMVDEARLRLDSAKAALAGLNAALAAGDARIQQAQAGEAQAEADQSAAQAKVQVAAAAHRALTERMGYATIKAPFSGVITQRLVHPGAMVQSADQNGSAMALLRLERTDSVRIAIHIPMDSVAALNPGDAIAFTGITTAPGATFEGTITRTAGALGSRSRMMQAEVELENPVTSSGQRALQPGAYGNLTVMLEQFPACPSVPASACFNRGGSLCVFVLEGSTLRLSPITPIFQDGTTVGVSAGLTPGQEVVASGFSELIDGQTVRASQGSVR